MSNGRLTIWIDEREALPVRAIPYVAGWETPYSPAEVAESLARVPAAAYRLRNLVAYHRPAGKPLPVMASDWTAVVAEVKDLEAGLHEQRPGVDAMHDHAGYAAWRKRAALKLPAGAFVWLDEFLREREADRMRKFDKVPVTLAPMLDGDTRVAVLEGYEDCPRRGPDADRAMIGYPDFMAICHVDDRKNFGRFRLGTNGLYVDLPDADARHTPEERPAGPIDKPSLPLPCTLGQLRAFLLDAGMTGYIDEGAIDAVLAVPYKNICRCLGDYWGKSWCALPNEQRKAWRKALGINFEEIDAGRKWDSYDLKKRQGMAEAYDAEHDPANEGARNIGWWDATMNAAMWLKRVSVKPDEAAMLLCRIDPLSEEDPERIYVDDDKASPDRYRLLRRVFLDIAEADPKPRTLLDWCAFAKREGIRHHQWIDEYVPAQIEELPAKAGSDGGTVKVGASGTAVSTLPEGIPTGTIIDKFNLSPAWADKLKHIRRNPFLQAALMRKGCRRSIKTPATAHIWNPVAFAEILIKREGRNPRAMEEIITRRFADWQDAWYESMERVEADEYST